MPKANWQVTRFCCIAGVCIDCHSDPPNGERRRIVHAQGLTEERARELAADWQPYYPFVEEMPVSVAEVRA